MTGKPDDRQQYTATHGKTLAHFGKLCLVYMGLLVLLMGGGYLLFCLREPFPTFVWVQQEAAFAGPIAGFFIWLSLVFVRWARQNEEDTALLRRRGFLDGERVYAGGTIKALGPLLRAPLTGRECVGYSYLATHRSTGGGHADWKDYKGYAMTPFVIRCPQRDVRPIPEADEWFFQNLPTTFLKRADEGAVAYLEKADFGERGVNAFGDVYHVKETVNGPGDFRYDMSTGDPPTDPRICHLTEQIIPPDAQAYVVGKYSEEQGAILPDTEALERPFRIELGDARTLAKETRKRYVYAAFFALVAVAIGLLNFLLLNP